MQPTNATDTLTDKLVRFLRTYYKDEVATLAQRFPNEQRSIYVDYSDVFQHDTDIADDLLNAPQQLLEKFDEALALYDLPVDVDLTGARVRVYNLPENATKDVSEASRHDNIGSLLDVQGQVQKLSKVKKRIEHAVFECQRCNTPTEVPQIGEEFQKPYECPGCERQGPFKLNTGESEYVNHQFARVQQPPERTKGGEGETIDVHLENDLIDGFTAGDRVTLTGVLDVVEPSNDDTRNFETNVEAKAVQREESDYEDVDVAEYKDEIEAIANAEDEEPYQRLIDSINPEHHGDEDVKLAIALQLFGGWSRNQRKRGDSHILLMGDPGCGKSTFLQAVDDLAPRSTYASGKGATAAGLTAAAVADDFGDTEWGLEAGALVLADGGIACIDEIDKVNDTAVSSLHDALESQKVRVHKAGINATLNARTAMLSAGNPKPGRFDPYQPRAQQIDLGPTLMSRFDLMFMISDSPDADVDREVVDHMMRSRRAAAKKELGEELTDAERKSIEPDIPREVLRAYIAYAKENVTPYIREDNTEAREYLREEFLKIRLANIDEEDNPVPVTYRQQEAIERLAEASARVRLSNEVTKDDVDRALNLVRTSMEQVGIDPETGEFDADVIETGQSKSQRDRRKQLMAVIEEKGGTTADELTNVLDMDRDKVDAEIQALKDQGMVYELNQELRKA